MPAPTPDKASTSKADADKPDTGEATTSTSATDASTTEGRTNVLSTTAFPVPPVDGVQRVEVVQAPAEPAVYYGEDAEKPAPRDHVRADYKPFEW